ncbi:DUF3578 domain-containing protein [Enterocloster bolteae]|uniref:DUF3578 domain-containing protein n=1 Tax=Enterocloster bolteae TaxID=208479 RepID=UPI00210A2CE1|nr:DUF3578 domain-containing protein [Enterocloster bolteae]MCQ4754628.1 DUF3578 domain-containing protein [Enterocloster bolteae]
MASKRKNGTRPLINIAETVEKGSYLIEVQKLEREMNALGLRNSDLSFLTGWSTSKTSKLINRKQNPTWDDLRTWATVMGYLIIPKNQNESDIVKFIPNSESTNIRQCVSEVYFDSEDDNENENIRFKMPFAVMGTLGVNIPDYLMKACVSAKIPDPFNVEQVYRPNRSLYFYQRNISVHGELIPIFGYWFDPDMKTLILSLCMWNQGSPEVVPSQIRDSYRDMAAVENEKREKFETYRRNNSWLPKTLVGGEVISEIYDLNSLPTNEDMQADLVKIFQLYCKIVLEMKGIDLQPDSYKRADTLDVTPIDQFNMLTNQYNYSPDIIEHVRVENSYLCEFDNTHKSFDTDAGKRYMDVIPLIPAMYYTQYGNGVLSEANLVCVCPICSAKLKYGRTEDREDMLMFLHRKHKVALENNGTKISLAQLLSINNLQ